MFSRRAASEFPNDNPELHDGLVWTSESVCGAALPTLRLRPVPGKLPKVLGPSWEARRPTADPIAVARAPVEPAVAEPEPIVESEPVPVVESEPVIEPEPVAEPLALTAEPPAPEPENVPAALTPETSPFDALVQALVRVALDRGATKIAASLPDWLAGGRAPTEAHDRGRARKLLTTATAWRAALDGTAPDLAACGETPLDVWAAELLAELLAAPADRETLRRALRRQGVAAFGMRSAA